MILRKAYRRITPFQMITLSFILTIFAGGILLYLPVSGAGGSSCAFIDALFTSCSAVCVTGLVVRNTATFWSPFGKTVILMLIQIGGLGVVTGMVAISLITGRQIGLRHRNLMQNALNAPRIGGIIHFTRFLLIFTAAAEGLGALFLAVPFIRDFGAGQGILKAVFHSVSAFCNAGFDLLGEKTAYVSLGGYRGDAVVNCVVMALIVSGGLGFLTWDDLIQNQFHWKKLRLQSRLVILVSAFLILVPAVLFAVFEFNHEAPVTRVLLAVFQSVTTRTAGFNTADLRKMSEASRLIMILLMMIGGSSGSTAGGMKTTTFAVMLLAVWSFVRQKKEVSAFGRKISVQVVLEAFTLLVLYIMLLIGGTAVMSAVERLPVLDCMFECASALGTVGLTMGITPSLGSAGKVLLILFMYIGRVGGLTLAYAALSGGRHHPGKLPEEKILVG